MNFPLTLPLHEIKVENRQRLDYGDLSDLKDSIAKYGLIQPVVINQDNRLLAGGRRLRAFEELGLLSIPVVYKNTLSEDENYVLELEENIRRRDETWQEKCLHIATIHETKQRLKAQDMETWGLRQTGEMLGESLGSISIALQLASRLRAELPLPLEQRRFFVCESYSAAIRLITRDREDEALAILAQSHVNQNQTTNEEELTLLSQFEEVSSSPDLLALEREQYYSNPLNPPGSFEAYWEEKQARVGIIKNTIYLSNRFHCGDSISFMHQSPGRFDHIITDIPYGIDMEMLNQQNEHGGFKDLDTVEELHDVTYNLKLIADFFPAAYAATKDKAFVITWCDQMLWQYMYDLATKAGFAVQRWPITWVKTSSCMNQCTAYNTTKDTEIAIVCRKKGATVAKQPNTSVITASKDDLSSSISHPFAKPFAVWEFLANLCSIEGQSILEPFAGRGSGVISMLRLNRNVIGVELDQSHFNALIENVKTLFYLPLNPNAQFK